MRVSNLLILILITIFISGCFDVDNTTFETDNAKIVDSDEEDATMVDSSIDFENESEYITDKNNTEVINEIVDEYSRGYIRIIADILNVRNEPTINSDIVAQVYEDRVYTIEEKANDENGDDWYYIRKGAYKGWIASWFTEPIKDNYLGYYEGEKITKTSDITYNPIILSSSELGSSDFQGYLFGGFSDSNWYTINDFEVVSVDDKMTVDLVKGDELYRIYDINGFVGELSDKYPSYGTYYSAGYEEYSFNYDMKDYGEHDLLFGISCDWDPMPRTPEFSADGNKMYLDIDGDSVEEVFERRLNNNDFYEWYLVDEYEDISVTNESGFSRFIFADLNDDNVLEMILGYSNFTSGLLVFEYKYKNFYHVGSIYIGD